MLRDLMLGSDALSGQQTLPDGSIIGYDANTPDDMIAAVANPQPPMSEIQQQQTEQPRTPQRISDLLVSQRPQDFGDQQRFDEAYQFKQQMPEGQSYLRNNTTGAVQTLPSGQRQNAATAPSNAFNDLIRFGQVNSIDPATIGRLIKYQSSVQAGMPSAKDLYTASFKYNKPIGEMLDYYGAAAAGQSAQNAAQMKGEKDRLGLEKQRLELAQLQANPSSEYDKAMAQERAKRDIFASMPPAMREAEEVKRLGIKLKPGEKYNINKGEIELIPGSVPYNKQAAEVRKESTGLKGLDRVIGNMLDRVSAVEKSPGLSSAVGFWDAATPAIMSGWNAQDKATARAYITNLQEYLQTKGLADLRASGVAPGSITEKEWSKFATMVGNIDPTMDEKSFQKELNNLKTYAANARAEAAAKEATLKKQYGPMWEKYAVSGGEVAPAAPEQGGVVRVKSVNDAMKLKSGTRFIDPNGVERVRP